MNDLQQSLQSPPCTCGSKLCSEHIIQTNGKTYAFENCETNFHHGVLNVVLAQHSVYELKIAGKIFSVGPEFGAIQTWSLVPFHTENRPCAKSHVRQGALLTRQQRASK